MWVRRSALFGHPGVLLLVFCHIFPIGSLTHMLLYCFKVLLLVIAVVKRAYKYGVKLKYTMKRCNVNLKSAQKNRLNFCRPAQRGRDYLTQIRDTHGNEPSRSKNISCVCGWFILLAARNWPDHRVHANFNTSLYTFVSPGSIQSEIFVEFAQIGIELVSIGEEFRPTWWTSIQHRVASPSFHVLEPHEVLLLLQSLFFDLVGGRHHDHQHTYNDNYPGTSISVNIINHGHDCPVCLPTHVPVAQHYFDESSPLTFSFASSCSAVVSKQPAVIQWDAAWQLQLYFQLKMILTDSSANGF